MPASENPQQVVLDVAAQVTGFSVAQLADSMEADLIRELGVESFQMTELWSDLEEITGQDLDSLVLREPRTLREIVAELAVVLSKCPDV